MANDFSKISSYYDQKAVVQKSASGKLFDLVKIRPEDDVLDIGCGTGQLTQKIRNFTNGRVVGIDPSPGMIETAVRNNTRPGLVFEERSAESLCCENEFDTVISNSAFQWFKNPELVLRNIHRALRPGGRIGMQAPARKNYCPNFIDAVERVASDPRTRESFRHFVSPWIFLETAEEYKDLFRKAGFYVHLSEIEEVTTFHTPVELQGIFSSAALAAYLNQDYYSIPVGKEYERRFMEIVEDAFARQAGPDGEVALIFFRVYLLADKL